MADEVRPAAFTNPLLDRKSPRYRPRVTYAYFFTPGRERPPREINAWRWQNTSPRFDKACDRCFIFSLDCRLDIGLDGAAKDAPCGTCERFGRSCTIDGRPSGDPSVDYGSFYSSGVDRRSLFGFTPASADDSATKAGTGTGTGAAAGADTAAPTTGTAAPGDLFPPFPLGPGTGKDTAAPARTTGVSGGGPRVPLTTGTGRGVYDRLKPPYPDTDTRISTGSDVFDGLLPPDPDAPRPVTGTSIITGADVFDGLIPPGSAASRPRPDTGTGPKTGTGRETGTDTGTGLTGATKGTGIDTGIGLTGGTKGTGTDTGTGLTGGTKRTGTEAGLPSPTTRRPTLFLDNSRCTLCKNDRLSFPEACDAIPGVQGCSKCKKWGLVCEIDGQVLRPHPTAVTSVCDAPKCVSCTLYSQQCDRTRPCYSCVDQGRDPDSCSYGLSRGTLLTGCFTKGVPGDDMPAYFATCSWGPGGPKDYGGVTGVSVSTGALVIPQQPHNYHEIYIAKLSGDPNWLELYKAPPPAVLGPAAISTAGVAGSFGKGTTTGTTKGADKGRTKDPTADTTKDASTRPTPPKTPNPFTTDSFGGSSFGDQPSTDFLEGFGGYTKDPPKKDPPKGDPPALVRPGAIYPVGTPDIPEGYPPPATSRNVLPKEGSETEMKTKTAAPAAAPAARAKKAVLVPPLLSRREIPPDAAGAQLYKEYADMWETTYPTLPASGTVSGYTRAALRDRLRRDLISRRAFPSSAGFAAIMEWAGRGGKNKGKTDGNPVVNSAPVAVPRGIRVSDRTPYVNPAPDANGGNIADLIWFNRVSTTRPSSPPPITPLFRVSPTTGGGGVDPSAAATFGRRHPMTADPAALVRPPPAHPNPTGTSALEWIPFQREYDDAVRYPGGGMLCLAQRADKPGYCLRPTSRACEDTRHAAPGLPLCTPCERDSRERYFTVLGQLSDMLRGWACAECGGGADAGRPETWLGTGQRVWGIKGHALGLADAVGDRPPASFMGEPLPLTGCACAVKLFMRYVCSPHRLQAVYQMFKRCTEMRDYQKAVYGRLVCFMCRDRAPVSAYNFKGAHGGQDKRKTYCCYGCQGVVVLSAEASTGPVPGAEKLRHPDSTAPLPADILPGPST
ncbi:hypothetical protein F4778DRAFT_346488 [Xylariomycetidae sp. FL2044]|nr:hypothetical protein F4778DRAFT_346488 [Xylariomycetidae sp. FL2044]